MEAAPNQQAFRALNPMFYNLVSLSAHPCFLQQEGRSQPVIPWVCAGCLTTKSGVRGVDVVVQDRVPRGKPLNLVWGGGVGLIHQELIDCIGPEIVERDLYLGGVTGRNGNTVPDWFTYHGRCRVIIRGTKDLVHRSCEQCDRAMYSATGTPYLYPAPPARYFIYESDVYGLIVPEPIRDRVLARNWRMLGIQPLPVLDSPLDGLGIIPAHCES